MKKQLQPLTFEIRKQIQELSTTLPQVPYLMRLNKGKEIVTTQMTRVSRVVTGKEILKKNPNATVNGMLIYESQKCPYQGTEYRLLNHKVQLTEAYQKEGQLGIDKYIGYVEGLDAQMKESAKPNENILLESNHKEDQPQVSEMDLPEGKIGDEPSEIKE